MTWKENARLKKEHKKKQRAYRESKRKALSPEAFNKIVEKALTRDL